MNPSFQNMLRWSGQRIHFAATVAPSAAQALPSGFTFEVRASVDCYIRFGQANTVEAAADSTSSLFLRGAQTIMVPVFPDTSTDTHGELVQYTWVSVIKATGEDDGVVQFERIH